RRQHRRPRGRRARPARTVAGPRRRPDLAHPVERQAHRRRGKRGHPRPQSLRARLRWRRGRRHHPVRALRAGALARRFAGRMRRDGWQPSGTSRMTSSTRYLPASWLSALLLLALLPSVAAAGDDDYIDDKVIAAGYLSHHPDLRHRIDGMKALDAGFPRDAMTAFLKSAKFADKPAQAMLANIYWEGIGTKVDRPRGYAWMDIAAERGYPDFLGWRERYWQALSPEEQREAIRVGQ